VLVPRTSSTPVATWSLPTLVVESETCVGSRVHLVGAFIYRMDLPGPTTSVGTRTDYSVGPCDYPACATRHLMA
jgi:hypothetical protein